MLARRLLLLGGGSGGIPDVGYTMTADEVQFWQDQAALLDPLAYSFTLANSTSTTNSDGRPWYLVNGWQLDAGSAGTTWFHRPADVHRAMPIASGQTIATGAPAGVTAFMYICKPSLVVGSDSRYVTDPRGLYFGRVQRMATLTQYQIGTTNTGGTTTTLSLPTDFTYGMTLQTSVHDVAWLILGNGSGAGTANTHNEISDTDRIRWAEPTIMPFTRADMPKVLVRGVSQTEGRATLNYLKLPGDW